MSIDKNAITFDILSAGSRFEHSVARYVNVGHIDHESGTAFVTGDEQAPEYDRIHHRPGQGHRGYNKAGELDHERGTGSRRALWICWSVLARSSTSSTRANRARLRIPRSDTGWPPPQRYIYVILCVSSSAGAMA